MLRIVNIEEIQGILNSISALIDLQQQHDSTFDEKVKEWLVKLEKSLESNRIMQVGEIATLRGLILSAEHGIIPPGIEVHRKSTKRKIIEAAVTISLRNSSSLITELLQKEIDRVSDAERMMRQLLAMAKAKGLLETLPDGEDRTEFLKIVWQVFSSDPELAPGTINVEGFVGPHDALVVLDRTLTSDFQ